jgi:hypothetical protein
MLNDLHKDTTSTSLFHVLEEVSNTSPSLLAAGQDLVGGQDEAVAASVAELSGESVLGADDVVGIVDAVAGGLVNGVADGAGLEAGAEHRLDGARHAPSQRPQLRVLGSDRRAGVAVGWEHEC